MKFHYRKSLIITFIIALLILIMPLFFFFWALDPLTLARSQNRQIASYLSEARNQFEENVSLTSGDTPLWFDETRKYMAAAFLITKDQAKILEELAAKEHSGLNLGTVIK